MSKKEKVNAPKMEGNVSRAVDFNLKKEDLMLLILEGRKENMEEQIAKMQQTSGVLLTEIGNGQDELKKKVKGLEILSGGERSLVSTAALFALISVSPPPFLVLDEIDAALDERNARRFSELLKDFAMGTVGFRCSNGEHALFRKIKVVRI